MKKQTVYIPVTIYENHNTGIIVKHIHSGHKYPVNKETGYFFTEEQLNELLSNVIKDTLDTASEKAEIEFTSNPYDPEDNSQCVNNKSILNTFEETYKKHKV